MTLPNLFIDNTTLNNIFGRGAYYNATSGVSLLNALAKQYNIVITDVIDTEAFNNPNYGGDNGAFATWMSDNGITPVPTGVSIAATDAGEISMVTTAQSSPFSSQTNYIASDDTSYFTPQSNNGSDITDVSKIFQIQDLGNQLLDNGQLSVDQYITLASSNATMNKGNPNVTQWLTPEGAEDASPLTYDPATNSVVNGNPDGTNITASQAAAAEPSGEAGAVSSLAQIGAAIEQIAATNPTLATVLAGTVKGLASTGLALMAYDILTSGATAVQQASSGNFSGATLTIENLAARISLGLGGAEAGASIGVSWGALGGPVGIVVGGIIGGVGGAIFGVRDASTVVNAINTGVQSAVSHIAQAVSSIDPSFSTTLGGSNLAGILTLNGSGVYQLPSSSVINESAGQFAASVDGNILTTTTQGDTSASVPTSSGTQVMVNTSGSSDLSPGNATPGTDEYTGYTVNFTTDSGSADGSPYTATATVLYRNADGNYVIDPNTETIVSQVTGGNVIGFSTAPTALGEGVTINSITPPTAPTNTSVTTQSTTNNPNGSQTIIDLGITGSSIEFNQTTDTGANGAINATIFGSGDSTDLNDAAISLAAGAAATVAGNANTIAAAAGAAVSIAAGSAGNTVDVNGTGVSINTTGNDGTVASGTTVLAGPVENVTYDTMEVSVGSSDTATITGTDGSMEISNDVGGSGGITNIINWNAGGSQVQVLSGLPGGETSSSDNYSGSNGTGTNTSDAINYSGGYSELQTYSGLPSGEEEVIDSWSGLNLTGTEGSIVTNNTNNSSQIETFDPGIGVTTSVADYTGLNASGTETQNTDNWTGGGSQLQLLADLPSGDSEILDNYQDADAQGKLVSTAWDYTNDTSEILLYTPDPNVLDDAEIFSGLDGGGAEQYAVVNYTGVPIGSEYQQFAGVPAGTLENIVGYAGASLTGSIKYNVANYTDDYSQVELLAPASGINNTDQSFNGLNGSGSPTAEQIYNANNTTDLITYDFNGNADAAMDTFYQGSTELGYGVYLLSGQFGGGTYNGLSIGLFTDDDGYAVNIDGFDPYDGTDDYDPVDDAAVGGFGSGGRFGLGNTLSSNDSAITLTDGESATITGSGNTVNAASDDTITMSDSGPNTVALAGNTTSLADSGAGDTYSVTGQSNYLNVSNATIQVADNVAIEIDGNTSTLALGNDDTVILDAGSYLMNATLSGSGSTLTDNGFADTILVGGSSNTIDFSAGGNAGDALAGNLVTFNGTGEQIALSGLETITLQSGTQTTLIGSDGTMTVNNDASGGLIRNTIDWNAGGSEVQTFTPSASGLTEDAIGYSGSDGSGNQLYEQQASTDSSGNITASISGEGAVSNVSNASISLADNATATLNGNGNTVTVGNDGTLNTGSGALLNTITLSGDNAVLNDAGSEDTVTLSGASDTAVLSGANMNGSTVTVSGSNASVEFTAASNDNVTFGLDAMGTLLLQMAQDYTGTVAGLVGGDGIDFANFQFSNGATISNVTGSGAAGTDTVLTISDDGINAQILLMNQYTAQYGASASAYALTADSTQPNAGTLLQLAAAH